MKKKLLLAILSILLIGGVTTEANAQEIAGTVL
jgi:hypothetical protein